MGTGSCDFRRSGSRYHVPCNSLDPTVGVARPSFLLKGRSPRGRISSDAISKDVGLLDHPTSLQADLDYYRPERADLRSSRSKILTRPTRPGCQTYLPSHDGQGCANQTTSRLPQARRRCFQAGRRDARPSEACHTDSLRRSTGRASSSRPASAPWCGADQASGSPPHRRVPKVPRTQRLAWHS